MKSLTSVGGKLYWINGTTIQSVATTGGTPTTVVTDTGLESDLTSDGTSLYFVVQTTSDAGIPGWEIDSTDMTGANRKTVVSGVELITHGSTSEIFIVAGNLYFLDFSVGVDSVPVAGGTATPVVTAGSVSGLLWADASGLYMQTASGSIVYTPLTGGSTTSTIGTPPGYVPDLAGTVWANGTTAYYVANPSSSTTTLDLYKSTPPAAGTMVTSWAMERQASIFGDSAGMYLIVSNGGGTQGVYKVDPASGAQTLLYKNALYGAEFGVQALDATNVYFATVSASVYTLYSHPR